MKRRILAATLALICGMCCPPKFQGIAQAAVDGPTAKDKAVARAAVALLSQKHYSHRKADRELGAATFDKYIAELDPGKTYFTKSDVEYLSRDRDDFGPALARGELTAAYTIYRGYQIRVAERAEAWKKLLSGDLDLSADETIIVNAEALEYPKDKEEANDRIRREIKRV